YKTIFTSSIGNIQNSIILACGALVLSIIISIFVSYFVVRQHSVTLDFLTTIPLIVPGIAFGIALIQTFNVAPLQLTGTATILIIAYAIRRLPYMVRSTVGTMRSIKVDIEEAAENLGASALTAAITVIGPLMIPGIAAGSILVFVTVIKETSISILMDILVSLITVTNTRIEPAAIPGIIRGPITVIAAVNADAPRFSAASSMSTLIERIVPTVDRTIYGSLRIA